MNIVHYLDSARLGLMTPSACRRHEELARFASVAAGSPMMDTLLRDGGAVWPDTARHQFPSLAEFPGIGGFRTKLAKTLGCREWQRLVLGTSSNTLIQIAGRLLFGPCRRVMTTDFVWPVYRKVLERLAIARSRELVVVPVRDLVFSDRPNNGELTQFLCDQYTKNGCDGVFLTSVSYDGIRLPAERVIKTLRDHSALNFSVVDGAQELAQVEHTGSLRVSDFYMTGGHKWVGGFIPVAIGAFGANRSVSRIESVLSAQFESGEIDDPLMRMCWDSREGQPVDAPSTANIAALFACDAAVNDLGMEMDEGTSKPLSNGETEHLFQCLEGSGWRHISGSEDCRTRTCVLRNEAFQGHLAGATRSRFASVGLALTAYDHGNIRLSVPRRGWAPATQTDVGNRIRRATVGL